MLKKILFALAIIAAGATIFVFAGIILMIVGGALVAAIICWAFGFPIKVKSKINLPDGTSITEVSRYRWFSKIN